MTKRILLVVTNVGQYETDPSHPTGLWLSELTHAHDLFAAQGYEQTIISPRGGKSPLEPRAELPRRRQVRQGVDERPRDDGAAQRHHRRR